MIQITYSKEKGLPLQKKTPAKLINKTTIKTNKNNIQLYTGIQLKTHSALVKWCVNDDVSYRPNDINMQLG